jgi:hypothetical protein
MTLSTTNEKTMGRATLILGFALLVIAATLAASITLRNAPGDSSKATPRPDAGSPQTTHPHALAHTSTTGSPANSQARNPRNQANHKEDSFKSDALRVALPEPWLTTLPPEQQVEWRTRTATVERAARKKLDRLTTDLDLTPAQCDKMFPLIVRSTPGYDPVMLTGGNLAAKTPLAADEEIHQVLDPQQQALVEDQEVNRLLWWQDTLARLEADLIDSTGGVTATIAASPTENPTETPTTPAATTPATEERVAPAARENGNLFDLLDP